MLLCVTWACTYFASLLGADSIYTHGSVRVSVTFRQVCLESHGVCPVVLHWIPSCSGCCMVLVSWHCAKPLPDFQNCVVKYTGSSRIWVSTSVSCTNYETRLESSLREAGPLERRTRRQKKGVLILGQNKL